MSAIGWTAILLAGQRPGPDPLAAHFGQRWKALVPVAGVSMLARVARTLLATPSIARVVVLAQEPDALFVGDCAWLAGHPRVVARTSHGGIAGSVAALAGDAAAPWPILLTTADHPLLTAAMIEAVIADARGIDVAVGVVGRRTLTAAYPANRRTWLAFAGEAWSGANIFALTGPAATRALAAWSAVEQDRKKALALVWHFGPLLALRALTRTITLDGAVAAAARRLGFTARAAVLPWPEAAIDVDKLGDHDLAQAILATRLAKVERD